ncbi:MAG: NADPH-dependent glutamate synthase [Candidatus Saganbacteria bacterium]|nr:NADPH-dependent glutamate synthase [Candidatus Saganbacteria bacterium]
MPADRHKIPERPVADRIKDFEEVALPFDLESAKAEAKRCIQCKKPKCVDGCPVEIDIPAFIKLVAEGKQDEALAKIKEKNALPAVCGRVCPQEDQCEKLCILGIKGKPVAIGALERFASEQPSPSIPLPEGEGSTKVKVAVVGSGPAGITCAADLAHMGYKVTMFESLSDSGGVLIYGIPEFRLPKKIVRTEIEYVKSLGVELLNDVLIGKTLTIEDLFKDGYKAIFVGSGAGLPNFMRIPGENLLGVYSANEFLCRINMMKAYKFPKYLTPIKIGKKVAVFGAGNVAMDAARCALRLGADEVKIIYRRAREQMPARIEEIERAEEEGIDFHLLTAPTELFGNENGWIKEAECLKMELGEPDKSGRRRPVPVPNSEFRVSIDTAVIAIGNKPNPLIPQSASDLKTEKWGGIIVDPATQMSSIPGVFAGGDIVRGAATVISAMGDGKVAARKIKEFLNV